MFAWFSKTWNKFHNWCAKVAPGVKVFLISAVGVFGSAGAAAQEYLTGVPLEKFVTAQEALIVTTVLFTLTFWARALTNRATS